MILPSHVGGTTVEVSVRDVSRRALVGALVVVTVTACGSDESSSIESASTTATTPTTVPATTTSTTGVPTTTAVATTTTSVATTSTMTTVSSYELGVWAAPADGQWFNELPIPWVFAVWPEQEDPPGGADGVPGAMGWVRQEAVVTVNGLPTETEECRNCMYQEGDLLQWRIGHGVGDPSDWDAGENLVVFEATFIDGVVVREERAFQYEPSLDAFTGWMVELDRAAPSVTFAAATFESADDDGTAIGPVTSVVEYPIRNDAAFILLDPDSAGQPPASVINFDEFTRLLDAAEEGCPPSDEPWNPENQCFFASNHAVGFFSPVDEPGYPFIIYITENGEIQQLEQTWGP